MAAIYRDGEGKRRRGGGIDGGPGRVVSARGALLLQGLLPLVLGHLPALPPDSPPLAIDAGKVVTTLMMAQFVPLCLGLALRNGGQPWRIA